MRVYISGPITGTTDYMERFQEVEDRLKAEGYDVINPAKIGSSIPFFSWEEYMRLDVELLDMSDAAFFMEGWEDSRGCRLENSVAEARCLKIIYE